MLEQNKWTKNATPSTPRRWIKGPQCSDLQRRDWIKNHLQKQQTRRTLSLRYPIAKYFFARINLMNKDLYAPRALFSFSTILHAILKTLKS